MKKVAFVVMFAVATPALADADTKAKRTESYDPGRVICRSERATGSRLATHKRCLTAQQWDEQKLIDRQTVERSQGGGNKNGGQ